MAVLLMASVSATHVSAVDTTNANRMNVVFVMDESGSMAKTDAGSLRYDAMDLFLGLATESGNYMGAVVFDHDIILKQDITAIDGLGNKTALSQTVRNVSSTGDTNIGKAIETATQMLQESGSPSLPSAVILLSDGNTDLGGDEARLQASYASRDNAIDVARSNGYKIYSVCLNTNGDADPAELREISAATGGTSVEVRSAEDLKEVFSQFYNIIYSTETITLGDMVIPESGEVEVPFDIPMFGVEEANIIISTLNPNTSYVLYQPSGIAFTEAELNDMKITAKTFSVLKIQNPEGGRWRLVVRGVPGDNIKVEMIYNSDLSILHSFNGGNPVYGDADVTISARISSKGTLVTDDAIYQSYPIHVVITDVAGGTPQDYEMNAVNGQAEYVFHLPADREYDVHCYSHIDNLIVSSQTSRLSAGNTQPVAKENPVEITRMVTLFSGTYRFDLSSVVSDAEDALLTYRIVQSDFDSSVVSVAGQELMIEQAKAGKGGELTVAAADSQGGTVEVRVILKVVNLLPILLLVLAAAVVAILAVILLLRGKEKARPINGRVMITPYTEEGTQTPTACEGIGGKMMLVRCLNLRENIGMDLKTTYFIHGEKDSYIYLISKEGYYTDIDPDIRSRKIRLDAEMEVDISSDIDFGRGIKVIYMPDDMDF